MPTKSFDLKFVGDDIDAMVNEYYQAMDQQKWRRQKNSIVTKGLKAAGQFMLPKVWADQPVDSGRMRMFTSLYRIKGGGWRIATPKRKELDIKPDSKGYYPASIEFGWTTQNGKKITGMRYMGKVMDRYRDEGLDIVRKAVLLQLDKRIRRHKNKADRLEKRQAAFFGPSKKLGRKYD